MPGQFTAPAFGLICVVSCAATSLPAAPRTAATAAAPRPATSPAAAHVVEQTLRDLKSGTLEERRAAAERLRLFAAREQVAPGDGRIIAALSEALREDEDHDVIDDAASALGWMKGPKVVEAGLAALRSDRPLSRHYAAQMLWSVARRGSDVEALRAAVAELSKYVHDRDRHVRVAVIGALGYAGAASVAPLVQALSLAPDPSRHFESAGAREVIEGLVRIGRAALPALVEVLDHKGARGGDADTRVHAAEALGKLKDAKREAVAALTAALDDPERRVRLVAAVALGNVGPDARPAVSRIIRLYAEPTPAGAPSWSHSLLSSLAHIGADEAQLPALLELLPGVTEEREQYEFARVVASVGKAGVPRLVPLLEDDRPSARRVATLSLFVLGPDAVDALPALRRALKREDLRWVTAEAIGAVGPAAAPAAPDLVADLARDDWARPRAIHTIMHHSSAARALARIGAAALPELRKGLRGNDPLVNAGCLVAVQEMGPAARTAYPEVFGLLRGGRNPMVRGLAVEAILPLAPGGGDGRQALVAELTHMLQDEHPGVAEAARRALGRLRKEAAGNDDGAAGDNTSAKPRR